jgi:hypothetical protein
LFLKPGEADAEVAAAVVEEVGKKFKAGGGRYWCAAQGWVNAYEMNELLAHAKSFWDKKNS